MLLYQHGDTVCPSPLSKQWLSAPFCWQPLSPSPGAIAHIVHWQPNAENPILCGAESSWSSLWVQMCAEVVGHRGIEDQDKPLPHTPTHWSPSALHCSAGWAVGILSPATECAPVWAPHGKTINHVISTRPWFRFPIKNSYWWLRTRDPVCMAAVMLLPSFCCKLLWEEMYGKFYVGWEKQRLKLWKNFGDVEKLQKVGLVLSTSKHKIISNRTAKLWGQTLEKCTF